MCVWRLETNFFVGQVYLVAENRVLKLWPSNIGSNEPSCQVFFGPEAVGERWGEVVGISISIWSFSLFITVKNRGLFAYSLHGRLLWSAAPAFNKSGYLQGCKRNVEDCFFVSSPLIDHCHGSLHVSHSSFFFECGSSKQHFFFLFFFFESWAPSFFLCLIMIELVGCEQ